jgi:hypothetical protein
MVQKHDNNQKLFGKLYKKFHNSINSKSRKILKVFSNLNNRESTIFPFTQSEREITPNFVTAFFSNGYEISIEVPTKKFIKKLIKKDNKNQEFMDNGAFYLFTLILLNKIEHDYKELRSQFMQEFALIASITWRESPIYYVQAFERLASTVIS